LPRLEVLELVKDRTWLAKVTNALNQHWQRKNTAKRQWPPERPIMAARVVAVPA
jgi:hypothetical protein